VNGMDWFLWLTVAWWALNLVLYIALIGKKLEFTVGSAVLALFIYTALIVGMLVTR
jgi:hypothetical protein